MPNLFPSNDSYNLYPCYASALKLENNNRLKRAAGRLESEQYVCVKNPRQDEKHGESEKELGASV